MLHLGTVTIQTKRLILRKFRHDDAEPMFKNWAADIDVCRYLTWDAHSDLSVTKAVIERFISGYESDRCYHWVIVLKETGEPVGSISVVLMSETSRWCEIGYCLSKSCWNKGLMSEALFAVMDFLFNKIGFHRIQAKHDVDNLVSGRVMQKCGMRFEGLLREANLQKSGRYSDLALYGMVKCE